MRIARPLATLAIVAILVAVPGIAYAQWTASASGSGSSVALTMPSGGTPSVSASGRHVAVSWPAAEFAGGHPVDGYEVTRYDAIGGLPQTIGGGCAGTVRALTCVDASVPDGEWEYTVRPIHEAWSGAEGPRSAPITISVGSPSLTLTTGSVTSLPETPDGSITGFVADETVTFRLDDAETGTVLTGSISPSPVPADGATDVSVTIPAGTTIGPHTVYAVGSLGSVASATITVADETAPNVSAAMIAKAEGGTTGFIHQGGAYYVYASAADPGDPASGVASVTADVSTITAGGTAVPLVAGSYTVGGVTYGYRSASLTATTPLAPGSYGYSVSATDGEENTTTETGYSVTVDNTGPSASDVQTANKAGGVAGRAESGDSITLTFSEPIEPDSVLAGWTGSATSVTLQLLNQSGGGGDRVQVWDAANTAQLPLGMVRLARNDYTTGAVTFTGSTMTMSGNSITVVLGTPSGAVGTVTTASTMQWTPDATPTDRAGNVCSTTAVSESGAADIEF